MSLQIRHRKSGSVTVVDLDGKIVVGDAVNVLLDTSKRLIGEGDLHLLFNLAGVSYLDSAGLGAFVKCHNIATDKQGRIKLLHVPQSIRDLLRITKLQSLFEVFDDEATAVQSYG